MRHVAPLSPVPSVHCAYFPSPRGCTPPAPPFLWPPNYRGLSRHSSLGTRHCPTLISHVELRTSHLELENSCRLPAIHHENVAGDEIRGVRGKENCRAF